MKQYLSELRFDEIKKVLENNSDLWDKVLDRAINDAYFWLGEYLHGARRLKDIDYSIGYDRGDYFNIADMTSDVLEWIKSVEHDYGLFTEDLVKDAERCNRMYDFLEYGPSSYAFNSKWYETSGLPEEFEGKSEDEVYDEYEGLKKDIEYRIFKELQSELSYWYTTPDSQLVGDLADVFSSYIEEFVDGDPDDIVVDTETGEIINLDDLDDDERDWMDPNQLKLPGFED